MALKESEILATYTIVTAPSLAVDDMLRHVIDSNDAWMVREANSGKPVAIVNRSVYYSVDDMTPSDGGLYQVQLTRLN